MHDASKKELNTYLILNQIKEKGPVSRTHLQQLTGLRPATITEITKELLERRLIITDGQTSSGRGRNHLLLNINNGYLCVISLAIEASHVTAIIGALGGEMLDTRSEDISGFSSPEQIIGLLIELASGLKARHGDKLILGVVVGDPGLLDTTREYSLFSTQLRLWKNVPLRARLADALALPVFLEGNDRLKALGEMHFGPAKGVDDFIFVQLGQGIGAGIVSNSMLVHGAMGAAGEIGHTYVSDGNLLCDCGSYGCLETVASMGSVVEQVREILRKGTVSLLNDLRDRPEDIQAGDIIQAVKANDKVCVNVVERAGAYIGIALANAINILNPHTIILSGPMCEFGNLLLDSIKSAAYRHSLNRNSSELSFLVSSLGESAAPLGAVSLVMRRFFDGDSIFRDIIYDNTGEAPAEGAGPYST